MTLKQYLLVMMSGTLIAMGVFFLALFQINPQASGLGGLIIFYASLLLSLVGLLSLLGFIWRVWLTKQNEPYFRQVKKSFRHAALLSILLVIALIFQSQRYLKWWVVIGLVVVFTLLETILLTKSEYKR